MHILTTGWLLMVIAMLAFNVSGSARRRRARNRRRSTQGTSSEVESGWWSIADSSYSDSSDGSSWSSSDSGSSSGDSGSDW